MRGEIEGGWEMGKRERERGGGGGGRQAQVPKTRYIMHTSLLTRDRVSV